MAKRDPRFDKMLVLAFHTLLSIISNMQDFLHSTTWTLLNSNLFIAFITLLVGSLAYIIYRLGNSANKRDAASILLLEIQSAQRRLREAVKHIEEADADEVSMIAEDIILMPTESWSKYKYLFIRNFERDEWDTVSIFYERTMLYDQAVQYNNANSREISAQIRTRQAESVMQFISRFVDEYPDDERESEREQETIRKAHKANSILLNNLELMNYRPRKPIIDARTQLRIINTYEMSSAIIKLQNMAQSEVYPWRRKDK